jgi:hypothetical protein
VWSESVALTAAFPLVGWWIDPGDPFFLRHTFPWIVFAPVLIGLRHGFAPGCTSASILSVLLVVAWRGHALGVNEFPAEPLLGLLAIAMLTGQFSDVWRRETMSLTAKLALVKRRGSEFARAHFLLELSHDRLEEQYADAPSLREALVRLDAVARQEGRSWPSAGETLMKILAAYAMLEAGALVAVGLDGLLGETLATFGPAEPVLSDDALVMEALHSRALVHVAAARESDPPNPAGQSRLLAVVPVIGVGGRAHAVLCVQAMPFVAFHRKNIEALGTLVGHFASVMTRDDAFDPDRERTAEFDTSVVRAIHDRREYGASSIVAVLWMRRGSPVAGIADVIIAGTATPRDAVCRKLDERGNALVFMALPAGDVATARALHQRIAAIVARELNTALEESGGSFAFRIPEAGDTRESLIKGLSQTAGALP